MLTNNDRKALSFLTEFRVATTDQINQVAYNNYWTCIKALKKLTNDKFIKQHKNTIGRGNVYSINRVKDMSQLQHDIFRNEFYLKLISMSDIKQCYVEKVYNSIRPDALFLCDYNNNSYFFLLEVETSNNRHKCNVDKYNEFFLSQWRDHFTIKPIIIYMTDKNVSETAKFEYRKVSTDLSNFMDIFK